MYLLGYIPTDNRLYLGDKELGVVSFQLLLSVLEYQTAVMRRDFETADKVIHNFYLSNKTLLIFYRSIGKIYNNPAVKLPQSCLLAYLQVLPTIPKEQRTRVAHFLEKQGFKQQALAVSSDPEHRFELAIQLSDMKVKQFVNYNNMELWPIE